MYFTIISISKIDAPENQYDLLKAIVFSIGMILLELLLLKDKSSKTSEDFVNIKDCFLVKENMVDEHTIARFLKIVS